MEPNRSTAENSSDSEDDGGQYAEPELCERRANEDSEDDDLPTYGYEIAQQKRKEAADRASSSKKKPPPQPKQTIPRFPDTIPQFTPLKINPARSRPTGRANAHSFRAAASRSPSAVFSRFFSSGMLSTIVENTNKYASLKVNDKQRKWADTTVLEIIFHRTVYIHGHVSNSKAFGLLE